MSKIMIRRKRTTSSLETPSGVVLYLAPAF